MRTTLKLILTLVCSLFLSAGELNDPRASFFAAALAESAVTSPPTILAVNFFFDYKESISVERFREKAREDLKDKNHIVDRSYACTINVDFQKPASAITVLFLRKGNEPFFEVSYNSKGAVVKVTKHEKPRREN